VVILLAALAITLAVEVPIVALFYRGRGLRMIAACVLANAATNLAMNLLLVRAHLAYDATLLTGESAALLAEACVYGVVDREHDWARALTASAAANLASFGAGLVLFA
jgi:hypothetical protein